MKRWRAMLPLALLLACGIALFSSGLLDRIDPDQLMTGHGPWQAAVAQHPWLARSLFLAALTTVVATGIPASLVVTVAGGLLFGLLEATILSALSMWLGSLALFAATHLALGPTRRTMPAVVQRVNRGYARHPLRYTLFLRLAPGLPWGPITAALAWLRCPLGLFAGTTGVGALITALLESSIGVGIGKGLVHNSQDLDWSRLLRDPYVVWSLLALVVLSILPLLLGRWHPWPHRTRPRRP